MTRKRPGSDQVMTRKRPGSDQVITKDIVYKTPHTTAQTFWFGLAVYMSYVVRETIARPIWGTVGELVYEN